MRYAGIVHMGSHSALRWSVVELALAGAGAGVASVGRVTEAGRGLGHRVDLITSHHSSHRSRRNNLVTRVSGIL